MSRRNYKKPHRAKRKKPLYAKPLFWKLTTGIFLIGGAVWVVCFSPALEVKTIEVAGTDKINNQSCVKMIEEQVAKKIASFDSKSILLFDMDQVKKDLLARFPQAQNIEIERQFPSKIIASVEERHGVAIFESAGKYFSLDSNGIAFEEAAQVGDLLKINDGNAKIEIGKGAVSQEMLNGILRIKGEIDSSTDIVITAAFIATPERVNIQTKDGWYAYFNPLKDIDNQITKLKAVITDESFKAKATNLEYVDVRFTRVYLKEKNIQ
jgi:cell division septal protein FtsQ